MTPLQEGEGSGPPMTDQPTMRERLIEAASSVAQYEKTGDDYEWQEVSNWPDVVDAILTELAEPNLPMILAGNDAFSRAWSRVAGSKIRHKIIPPVFTAMIQAIREGK